MSALDDILEAAHRTEGGREILREARSEVATVGEKVRYGREKGTWLIPDALRWIEAGGDRDLLKEREERRIELINKKYEHLSKEDKDSGWALAGEIGADVFDPAFLATGYVGGISKIAKLGNTARRLTSGALWGGVSAGDAIIHQVARGDDVNPTMVGVAGLVGGTLGLALPTRAVNSITSKGPKGDVKTLVSQEVDSVVPDSNAETVVRQALEAYESGDIAGVAALQSSRTNGELLEWADNIIKLYKREERNRRKGRKGAYSDKSWAALEAHKKTADEIYERFPDMLLETAEGGSSGIMGAIRELAANDNLNSNTVRTLVYRPLIGAGGGFGIGASLNLYDDETTYSPWLFAAVGAIGGAASKKIVASKFSREIKDAATGEIQNVMRRSLWTQANILFSGTMAARGNAFGGKLEVLTKAMTSQRGGDLKRAAGVSLEEAKEVVLQSINKSWNSIFRDLGLLGHKKNIVAMREDAYKLVEGFITLDDLVAKGYTQVEINTIERAGKAGISLVKSMTEEVRRVGMRLEQDIEGYVLPQIHDLAKIRANPEQARAAYIRAFIKQEGAKTPEQIAKATGDANTFFIEMMTGKKGGGRKLNNAFDMTGAEGDAAYSHTTVMRPLANHFEKARMFTNLEARKELQDFFVTDIDKLMKMYTHNSVPIIEFARMFGSGKSGFREFAGLAKKELREGETSERAKDGIFLIKQAIHKDFEAARAVEGISLRQIKALNKVERQQMKTIHDMVNGYFGMLHADSFGSNATMGNTLMSFFITGANTTMLTKVTISSLGDIVQPFQNSGVFNALKGYRRSFGKTRDFAEKTGFADVDVLEHELQAYILHQTNPSSRVQAGLRAVNQFYFRAIGLGKLTSFARRFAYNTGVEDAFKIAKDISKKSTSSLVTRGNNLGLDPTSISILNKFDNVEAAFADKGGERILNIAGRKTADRDALIPQLGNRRGFSQSRNPYIRSLGQFLSWAQAKTTQTNALVHRMENGDDALFIRMLGLIAIYDGVLTFKEFLGDPTGKYLEDEDEENYFQRLTALEQIGKSVNFGANFSHWMSDKMARLMSAHGNSHPSEELVPAMSYAMDLYEAFSPAVGDTQGTVWRNLMRGDEEGAALQTLKRLPFGRDINAWLTLLDNGLVDEASPLPKRSRILNATGGEVEDVPQVPREPDERIDKMTGEPYNKQAGGAFIDAEDPLRRLGFGSGGPSWEEELPIEQEEIITLGSPDEGRFGTAKDITNLVFSGTEVDDETWDAIDRGFTQHLKDNVAIRKNAPSTQEYHKKSTDNLWTNLTDSIEESGHPNVAEAVRYLAPAVTYFGSLPYDTIQGISRGLESPEKYGGDESFMGRTRAVIEGIDREDPLSALSSRTAGATLVSPIYDFMTRRGNGSREGFGSGGPPPTGWREPSSYEAQMPSWREQAADPFWWYNTEGQADKRMRRVQEQLGQSEFETQMAVPLQRDESELLPGGRLGTFAEIGQYAPGHGIKGAENVRIFNMPREGTTQQSTPVAGTYIKPRRGREGAPVGRMYDRLRKKRNPDIVGDEPIMHGDIFLSQPTGRGYLGWSLHTESTEWPGHPETGEERVRKEMPWTLQHERMHRGTMLALPIAIENLERYSGILERDQSSWTSEEKEFYNLYQEKSIGNTREEVDRNLSILRGVYEHDHPWIYAVQAEYGSEAGRSGSELYNLEHMDKKEYKRYTKLLKEFNALDVDKVKEERDIWDRNIQERAEIEGRARDWGADRIKEWEHAQNIVEDMIFEDQSKTRLENIRAFLGEEDRAGLASGGKAGEDEAIRRRANEAEIDMLLAKRGFNPAARAGILANISVETWGSFDYTRKQENGPGWGLFQLDPTGPLPAAYTEWRDENNVKDSAESQINFMHETIYGDKKYREILGFGHAQALQNVFENGSSGEVAEAFMKRWENPDVPHLDRRLEETRKRMPFE